MFLNTPALWSSVLVSAIVLFLICILSFYFVIIRVSNTMEITLRGALAKLWLTHNEMFHCFATTFLKSNTLLIFILNELCVSLSSCKCLRRKRRQCSVCLICSHSMIFVDFCSLKNRVLSLISDFICDPSFLFLIVNVTDFKYSRN